jgi:hypothetical protein
VRRACPRDLRNKAPIRRCRSGLRRAGDRRGRSDLPPVRGNGSSSLTSAGPRRNVLRSRNDGVLRLALRGPVRDRASTPTSPQTVPEESVCTATAPRRGFLALAGGAAMSVLAIALLPLRSLGGAPRPTLHATKWRRGVRLVTALGGAPLRLEDLTPGSATPVVPADASGDVNSIAVLVRLRRSSDLRAYSRICTYSGCAVSVFRSEESELVPSRCVSSVTSKRSLVSSRGPYW